MKLVAWNIRAGGGRRLHGIVEQLDRWNPDIVALSEFRATPPSLALADALAVAGLVNQRTTVDRSTPATNALLVASRWPLRAVNLASAPGEPRRWLHVNVGAPLPLAIMAVHIPNRATGRKYAFLKAVLEVAKNWRGRPALIVGDTNLGRIGIDEESAAFNRIEDDWMAQMEALGWHDAYRLLHGRRRAYTWYSPNGNNGFRLDQAFVHHCLAPCLVTAAYRWGGDATLGRAVLSDHAALCVEIDCSKNGGNPATSLAQLARPSTRR